MPEVQKSVLEHAAPKANQTPRLDGRLADDILPEQKTGVTRLQFVLEIKSEHLENPDKILNFTVTLPNRLTAKFIRANDWALVSRE